MGSEMCIRDRGLTRQQNSTHEIEVEIPPPGVQPNRLERQVRCDSGFRVIAAGCIDQNGGHSQLSLHLGLDTAEIIAAHGIGSKKGGTSPLLLQRLHAGLSPLGIAAHHRHSRTCFAQSVSHGPTESASCTDHHCHLAGKIEEIHAPEGEPSPQAKGAERRRCKNADEESIATAAKEAAKSIGLLRGSIAQAGKRFRNSRQAAAMSCAFNMALTTQMDRAPAVTTASTVPKWMPPIANHGIETFLEAHST